MSEINVDSIVSVLGETVAVSGETTYIASRGDTSLADAIESGAMTVVLDGFTQSGSSFAFDGGTVIGINDSVIANSTGTTALIGVAEVTGMTFSGNTGTYGSAIDTTSSIAISDSVFDGNHSTYSTGAVAIRSGATNSTISNSFFSGNTYSAMYAAGGTITLSGCTFIDNTTKSGGYYGAIYSTCPVLKVEDSYFEKNTHSMGAAIRQNGGTRMEISGSTFYDNKGAAIYVTAGKAVIADSLFDQNTGYAVWFSDNAGNEVRGSTFTGNNGSVRVTSNAGAVDSVRDCVITGDISSYGAIHNTASGTVNISGSTFAGNSVYAVHVEAAGTANITGSTFGANTGTYVVYGGATNGTVTVDSSSFVGNSGYAIYSIGNVDVSGSTFTGNGGALRYYGTSGDVSIADSLIIGESDGGGDGAIFTRYSGTVNISGSTFVGNSGKCVGVYENGTTNITGSTFGANTGSYAVWGNAASGTITVDSSRFDGNSNSDSVIYSAGKLEVSGSTFTGNKGALRYYGAAGTASVTNCVIADNLSDGDGSIIFNRLSGGTVNVSGSTFAGNAGYCVNLYDGGAANISGSTFGANTGSAVIFTRVAGGKITIDRSAFDGNNGVAVRVIGSSAKVSDSTFTGNKNTVVYVSNSASTVTIDGSVFENNTTTGHGAALYLTAGTACISNTTFADNSAASGYGGAMRLDPGTVVHLANVTVTGNVDKYNSAIFNYKSTVYLDGLLTLGADQRVYSEGSESRFYVNGGSFFTGLGAAKAVETNRDSWGNWYSGPATPTAVGGYYIFGLDNDMYVSNVNVIVSDSALQWTPQGTVRYATLEAAQTAGQSTVALVGYAQNGDIDVTLAGSTLVGGSAVLGGTINVSGGADLTLTGDVVLAETLTIDGGAATLSNFNLSVASSLFAATDAYTLVSGIGTPAEGDLTVTVDGTEQAMDEWFDVGGSQYRLAITDGALNAERRVYDTVYAVLNGATEIVLDGQTIPFAGREDVFDDIAEAKSCLAADGTLVVVGQTVGKFIPGETQTILVDSNITGYNEGGNLYAIITDGGSAISLRVVDSTVSSEFMVHGAALSGDMSLELDNVTLTNGWSNQVLLDAEVGGDVDFTIRDFSLTKSYALYLLSTNTVGGTVGLTLDHAEINAILGAGRGTSDAGIGGVSYDFTDTYISRNVFVAESGWTVDGDVGINLTGSTIGGYLAASVGGTVTGDVDITLDGSTVGDVKKRNSTSPSVGSLTLTVTGANTSVIGNMSEVDSFVIDSGASVGFVNTAAINLAGVTFGGSNALTFAGSAAVNFASQDLSDVAITVDPGNLSLGSHTIATGVSDMDSTITVVGFADPVAMDETITIGDYDYTFAYDGSSALTVSRAASIYDFVAAAPDGTTSVVIGGTVVALDHRYDTVADALTHLNPGGTLVVAGLTVSGVPSDQNKYRFSGNHEVILAGGANVASAYLYFTTENEVVAGDLNVTIDHSTIPGSYAISGNAEVAGEINVVMTGATVTGAFSACATDVAKTFCSGVNYTVTDSLIVNGLYGGGSVTPPTINGDVNILLTGSTVGGSKGVTGSRANNVKGSISVTLAGSTVSAVNKHDSGKTNVTAPMTLTISGATNSVVGSMIDVDNLVIDAGARADFTDQDLSDVALTVNGSLGVGTVATGVTGFGGYNVIGDADLFLKLDGTDLVMYERAADLKDGDAPVGNYKGTGDSNLVTGGVVEVAFFGTTQTSGNVRTVFTGGTVVNSMIGGALVLAGSSADLDTVMLDIHDGVSLLGGPSNGGMNYVAGYAYGANGAYALDATPTLSVTQSTLNFSGSEISGNFYAGAHARKGAYAEVGETVVTVSGGYIEKLYGGGWAERGDKTYTIEGGTAARSDVGTATVKISGGTIERLYAGGGNAFGGYTNVGSADLTISGGTVNFVFLGGRNINSSVGDATLTITGSSAQTLTRISGRNDCGADRTTTSTLNVDTFVTLDYLDYVDQINISEGNRLHIVEDVVYTNGNDLAVDLETDGFDGVWTLFSATDAADINTLAEARFYLNGGTTSYTMGDTMTIGGGTYSLNKSDLNIALSKI